tara:strand:+ start:349 stop:564 length:216 start_codon:yes stop_codon:yes gene_type:complete
MFKNKNKKGANTMNEYQHLIKKIDLLFYDLLNIETQSQILKSILSEASLRTLNDVAEDLENAISKQIKEVK